MSCSVAVSNSPVFSPSSSLFCNKTSILSPSAEAPNLTLTHLKPSSSPASSSFRLRLQKPRPLSLLSSSSAVASSAPSPSSGFDSTSALGPGSGSTILKRKRPARLDIPVAFPGMCLGIPATPCEVERESWRAREMDIRFIVKEGGEKQWKIGSQILSNSKEIPNRHFLVFLMAMEALKLQNLQPRNWRRTF